MYDAETSKLTFLKSDHVIGALEITVDIPILGNVKNSKIDIITSKLTTQFQHELIHAWEDYNRLLKDKESLFDIVKRNKDYHLPSGYNIVSEYNYFFNKQEQNAYISELKTYFERYPVKIKEYESNVANKLYDIIKDTSIYKKYIYLINSLVNISDVNEFKKLNKFRNATDNKIKKQLIAEAEKLKRKLENIIPKMIYDYIEIEYTKPLMEKQLQ